MSLFSTILLFLFSLSLLLGLTHQQLDTNPPPLNSAESELVYLALHSINPDIPWRTLYPAHDDLCLSAPHGVLCSYFSDHTSHVTHLNFGYVSEANPNPACSPSRATFPPLSSFPHLRKIFFYRCFTHSPVPLPALGPLLSGSAAELEEIVFVDNPALSGSIQGPFRNFTSLRRFILTGTNVSGGIPDEMTELPSLEQLTISGNNNLGNKGSKSSIPADMGKMRKLKILDLSGNGLEGGIPESLGQNRDLIKLDLSHNNLTGKIPESFRNLTNLEFLDLGYNKLGKFGVPLFIGELEKLKEVYLSGNILGGVIPEIWEKMGSIVGIGLSGVGLVGKIPGSMGVYLRNVSHILLDNNKLEGGVPKELGMLEKVKEVDLRNNRLSGRVELSVEFVGRVGRKLKVEGNSGLCIDKSVRLRMSVDRIRSGLTRLKTCNSTTERKTISNPTLLVSAPTSTSTSTSTASLRCWGVGVILVGVFW